MLKVLLELGRISNLPTVWTNCLAAAVLASGEPPWAAGAPAAFRSGGFALLLLAMSLMYTGGMFLNDAFDRMVDATAAPTRPIPSGRIRGTTVFLLGWLQLAAALLIVLLLSLATQGTVLSPAFAAAFLLSVLIVIYDAFHKKNPLSPLLMGLCRVGVYFSVGLFAVGRLDTGFMDVAGRLLLGSSVLLAYLMALTFLAKREGRGTPPPVPIYVMIAGISLLDGVLAAAAGSLIAGLLGVLGFVGTLRLQKFVRGT